MKVHKSNCFYENAKFWVEARDFLFFFNFEPKNATYSEAFQEFKTFLIFVNKRYRDYREKILKRDMLFRNSPQEFIRD